MALVKRNEHILAAIAEPTSGPGWANTPVTIFVRDAEGEIRREYLQPEEQSSDMRSIYTTAAAANTALTTAVRKSLQKR